MIHTYKALFFAQSLLEADKVETQRRQHLLNKTIEEIECALVNAPYTLLHEKPFCFTLTGKLSSLNPVELRDLILLMISDLIQYGKPWAYGVQTCGVHFNCDTTVVGDIEWTVLIELNIQKDTNINDLILYLHNLKPTERIE